MSDQDREEYEVQQEQWWEQQDKDEGFIMELEKRTTTKTEVETKMTGKQIIAALIDANALDANFDHEVYFHAPGS